MFSSHEGESVSHYKIWAGKCVLMETISENKDDI
jgi:hypothetical protein